MPTTKITRIADNLKDNPKDNQKDNQKDNLKDNQKDMVKKIEGSKIPQGPKSREVTARNKIGATKKTTEKDKKDIG